MTYIRSIFLTVLLAIVVSIGAVPQTLMPVSAENVFDKACQGADDATLCQENNKNQTPDNNSVFGANGILTKAISLVMMLVGVASVIMIMVGGFKYVTSSGDSANITSAKNTILYAVIGLVVALVAQSLIVFVIKRL